MKKKLVQRKYTYDQLVEIQEKEFPESILIEPLELLQLHQDDVPLLKLMEQYFSIPSVWYYLPRNSYGASEEKCCNGIRYGNQGAYMSLPWITDPQQLTPEECIERVVNNQCPACGAELEYIDAILDDSQLVMCLNINCSKSWQLEYDIQLISVKESY